MAIIAVGGFQGISTTTRAAGNSNTVQTAASLAATSLIHPLSNGGGLAIPMGSGSYGAFTTSASKTVFTGRSGGAPSPSTWTIDNTRVAITFPISFSDISQWTGKTLTLGVRLTRRNVSGGASTKSGPLININCAPTPGGTRAYVPSASTAAPTVYVEVVVNKDTNSHKIYYDGVLVTDLTAYDSTVIVFGCWPQGTTGSLTNNSINGGGEEIDFEDIYIGIDKDGEEKTGRLGNIKLINCPPTSEVVIGKDGSFLPKDPTTLDQIFNRRLTSTDGGSLIPEPTTLASVSTSPGVIHIQAVSSSDVPAGRELIGVSATALGARGDANLASAVRLEYGSSETTFEYGSRVSNVSSSPSTIPQVVYMGPGLTNSETFLRVGSSQPV